MSTPANVPAAKPTPAPAASVPTAASSQSAAPAPGAETPEEKAARIAREQAQSNPNDILSNILMMLLKAIFGSFGDTTSEYSEIDQADAAPSQGRAEARVAIEKPEVQAKLRALAGKYTDVPPDISPFTVNAGISSGLGDRNGSVGSKHHQGLDLIPKGTSLEAITVHNTMPGVVVRSETQIDKKTNKPAGYGNWVEVACIDGTRRRYGHLKERDVKVGDVIDQGATIGIMGNTGTSSGPHLHYEWRDASGKTLAVNINDQTYAYNDRSNLKGPVLASAVPAPAEAPTRLAEATPPKPVAAPAKPAAAPTVAEQVASLGITAKMHVAEAYEGTKSALSQGMKNAQATIGNILG